MGKMNKEQLNYFVRLCLLKKEIRISKEKKNNLTSWQEKTILKKLSINVKKRIIRVD